MTMWRSSLPLFPSDDGWPYPTPRADGSRRRRPHRPRCARAAGRPSCVRRPHRMGAVRGVHRYGLDGPPCPMKELAHELDCSHAEARDLIGRRARQTAPPPHFFLIVVALTWWSVSRRAVWSRPSSSRSPTSTPRLPRAPCAGGLPRLVGGQRLLPRGDLGAHDRLAHVGDRVRGLPPCCSSPRPRDRGAPGCARSRARTPTASAP